MYCYKPNHNSSIPKNFGNKSKSLYKLKELSLEVPPFVVITPANIIHAKQHNAYTLIQKEVTQLIPATTYAVRSNSLVEDAANSSNAGQFKTLTNISPENIADAVQEIVSHAENYLSGNLELFSVIIQEYITPDISGVTFTRSPDGARQFIVEYHAGPGDQLVSGIIKPKNHSAYWTENDTCRLPNWNKIKPIFKNIENAFGFPQDIEWCINKGKWYFLQSRNITTISPDEFKKIQYLETILPSKPQYRYIKNDVTDVIGSACPLTVSIVRSLYSQNGPISTAYKQHGVTYKEEDIFYRLSNEIYIDAEKDLKTILPAFSILNKKRLPKWTHVRGSIRTLVNLIALSQPIKIPTDTEDVFLQAINKSVEIDSLNDWQIEFYKAYESIFSLNLIAAKQLQTFRLLTHKCPFSVEQLLNLCKIKEAPEIPSLIKHGVFGNSIDIADESIFTCSKEYKTTKSKSLNDWFIGLKPNKQKTLLQQCIKTKLALQLRETGRWTTVSYIHQLKRLLKTTAKEKQIQRWKDLYYVNFSVIKNDSFTSESVKEEKLLFKSLPQIQNNLIIDSHYKNEESEISGISSGIAKGILVTPENIKKHINTNQILFVDTLSPSFTEYFKSIKGIYSARGGTLSHLAIMAREHKLPIIVGGDFKKFANGEYVEINGTYGTIKRLSK